MKKMKMEDGEKHMTIRPELIDELLKECADPKELLAEGGFLRQLTSALIGRCLETEMEEHLGYPKHAKRSEAKGNARNGTSRKTLKGRSRSRFRVIVKPALNRFWSPSIRPAWMALRTKSLRSMLVV